MEDKVSLSCSGPPIPTTDASGRDRSIPAWFGALVVAALWLLARPYMGLRHDAILYVGQALLHLAPVPMAQDIFFVNGSQDSFSLVSPLLAGLYARWGLDVVQIVLPGLCHAALMGVVFVLLRSLAPLERWLGLAALAVLPHTFGGLGVFGFAEGFLTGRTLAEPLGLAALVLVLHKRVAWALLTAGAAATLHPLVTLPVLVVGWFLLIQQDRRWAWAGLLALAPLLLAWQGVAPFRGLLQAYDDDWWRMVNLANVNVLLMHWGAVDWQVVVLDLSVLVAATLVLPEPLRRLAAAVVVATVALLLVSVIGADWSRNVLIAQLQVWRVLWLAHLLSLALLPALALHLWRCGPNCRLAMLALCAAVVAVNGFWEWGWVLLLWAAATLLLVRSGTPLRPVVQRIAVGGTLLAVVGLSLAVALRATSLLEGQQGALDLRSWLVVVITMPMVSLPLAAGLLLAYRRGQAAAVLALLTTGAALTFAVASWDRRSDWIRYVETGQQREHPFAATIPETAQVYWHGELAATWLLLRRPSYSSPSQSAGLLFNRDTALEFGRRYVQLAPLNVQATLCDMLAVLNGDRGETDCTPAEELVAELCTAAQGPDFMIFRRRLPKGVVASWTFNPGADTARIFHLYDCRQFR